ncbi:hypothetical protein FNV43_RR17209 [Rhamnella rubrinervis]|uniref:Uncharacterized protein n=1 Tax=Rhamnella rubrinervis TaxID=2594499 RepID=A0A8K0E3N6_9ROSA|nr:hypothetical protein FNV43_RR17209 [Rhamnella rubrinervis]
MASNMLIFTCLSLSLLVFNNEILPVDGRTLYVPKKNQIQNQLPTPSKIYKSETTKIVRQHSDLHGDSTSKASLANAPPTTPPSAVTGASQSPPTPAHNVSDFRPTAPGHSPGVGHSLQN